MDSNSNLLASLNFDSTGFKFLLDTQSLVDCTLACEGGKISAHKIVLSACSSYLAKILAEHPVEHPIIILPEFKIDDMKTLVHYMYTGELLELDPTSSDELIRTAAILGVNSLKDVMHNTSVSPQPQSPGKINDLNYTSAIRGESIATSADDRSRLRQRSNHRDDRFNESQLKCPKCNNDYQTICSYEYHMRKVHNVTTFRCDICNKSFVSLRYLLTDHMRRCHGWRAEQVSH